MKVFKAFLLLCGIGLSQSFNVDTSKGATYKTIRPYEIEANQAINYPIFFGYQFQIEKRSTSNLLLAGAPRYKKLGEPLPQPGDPRALNIGSLMTCRFRNSSESSDIRCIPKTLPGPPEAERGDSYGISLRFNHINSILMACSPPKLQKCLFQGERQNNVPGYCYRSNNLGSTWEQDPKTFDSRCPTVTRDIIFLLDGSDSVGEENFNTAKNWVIRLARNFNISDGSTKVGVIQYSHYDPRVSLLDQPYFITEVGLGQYTSQSAFANAVRGIELIAYDTWTAAALLYTLDEFQRSIRFSHQDTAKVLILLTDGKSTDSDQLRANAEKVRSQDIITFAIGVGNAVVNELGIIATGNGASRRRVFFVANFDALDAITQRLTNEISAVSLEGVQVGNRGDSHYNSLNYGEYGFSLDWSEKRVS